MSSTIPEWATNEDGQLKPGVWMCPGCKEHQPRDTPTRKAYKWGSRWDLKRKDWVPVTLNVCPPCHRGHMVWRSIWENQPSDRITE